MASSAAGRRQPNNEVMSTEQMTLNASNLDARHAHLRLVGTCRVSRHCANKTPIELMIVERMT